MSTPTPPPPFKLSRETQISIDREGRFFHEGDPITHPALAQMLARWLAVDPESGRFIVSNQVNWAFIQVTDTPLVVRALTDDIVHLSDGTSEPLALATLRLADDGAPYVDVRGGSLPARFGHSAAHEFLSRLEEDAGGQVTYRGVPVPRQPWAQARQRR
jgi:hypothetical protein